MPESRITTDLLVNVKGIIEDHFRKITKENLGVMLAEIQKAEGELAGWFAQNLGGIVNLDLVFIADQLDKLRVLRTFAVWVQEILDGPE